MPRTPGQKGLPYAWWPEEHNMMFSMGCDFESPLGLGLALDFRSLKALTCQVPAWCDFGWRAFTCQKIQDMAEGRG